MILSEKIIHHFLIMTNNSESPSPSQPERGLQNFSMQHQSGNAWFASELELKEIKAQIWKSQELIPSSDSRMHIQDPLREMIAEKLKNYFPMIRRIHLLSFPETMTSLITLVIQILGFLGQPRESIKSKIISHGSIGWKNINVVFGRIQAFLTLFSCRDKVLDNINICYWLHSIFGIVPPVVCI